MNRYKIANAIIDAWLIISLIIVLIIAIESKISAKAAGQAAQGMQHVAGFNEDLLNNLPVINLTDTERDLMAHVVMAEAEGEPFEGKVAVANVIINRARNRGQSVDDVIFAPAQFCTGYRFTLEPTEDCHNAVSMALDGCEVIDRDTEYFCEHTITFNNLTYVKSIGNHDFYKEDNSEH